MSQLFSGVFFPRSRTSDVVSLDDVIGTPHIGRILKVRWHGKVYTAKVVCVGTKEECEEKLLRLTSDGELIDSSYEICEGPLSPVRQSPAPACSCSCSNAFENIQASIEMSNSRLDQLEQLIKQEFQRLFRRCNVLEGNIEEILKRLPNDFHCEDATAYEFVPKAQVEATRRLAGGNVTRFALELEKEVYGDDLGELKMHVEKRLRTSAKIAFIKECVFKYYAIPVEARESVWRTVKNALNGRARRLRFIGENPITQTSSPS